MTVNSNIAHLLLSLILMFAVGCSDTGAPSNSQAEEDLRSILDKQVVEWNNGDIPAFMDTYVKTDALRFSSGGNVQRGYQETLERYQTRYPNRDAMGQLRFEDLEVQLLSNEWAEVHGRYRQKRGGDYADATGLFTLLIQNTADGWKILHDHTSAAD